MQKQRRHSRIPALLKLIGAIFSAVVAVVYLASAYGGMADPVTSAKLSVLGLAYPVALGATVLLMVVWLCMRLWQLALIPLLAIIASWGPLTTFSPLNFTGRDVAEADSTRTFRVLTYNVMNFTDNTGVRHTPNRTIQYILDCDADIVCLQEVNLPGEYDVARFFEKRFPGYHVGYFMFVTDKGSYGNVTLSKFPILNKGKLMFDKSSNLAIFTDLKIGEGAEIRVYNCHFESYNVSLSRLKKSVADKDGELMWETEEKMKKSIRRRPEQVDKVMSDIEDCTLEAIVTGDFNDNPMSYTYNRLKKGRDDSFVEVGKGFGATYSFLWPFIRIDYILYPSHFTAVSHSVPRVRYSDHYPVIAEINLK